jgi:hypothetical protein
MIVQELLAGTVVPAKFVVATWPAAFADGIVPVHVPRPAPMKLCAAVLLMFPGAVGVWGNASVKRTSVSAFAFGFVIVNVIVEVAPVATLDGLNDLVIVGAV